MTAENKQRMREKMVREQLQNRGIRNPKLLQAFLKVERHAFIPPEREAMAYDDTPVNIGHHQTISQPYIVAFMLDQLKLNSGDKVLEIGTGSGYQTALLAELVAEVYTVEIIETLSENAQTTLQALGYRNIRFKIADGTWGWPEFAPYDAIVVSAAAPEIPRALTDQMKPDSRMLIPVGPPGDVQSLFLIIKDREGKILRQQIELVRFVPLRRAV